MDWNTIVSQHAPAVIAAAWRVLGNITEAEDVAQDVFLEAFRSRGSLNVRNWSAYLRRIAVCRAIDRLRQQRETLVVDEIAGLESDDPAPQQLAVANELESRLRESLRELPPRESEVFSLRYIEGLSNTEIAEQLAITPGAVGVALSKARGKLQTLMAECKKESQDATTRERR